MSQKLTGTTIVVNPATMIAEVLLGGSTLPSWAEGLVGDHLLTGHARSDGKVPDEGSDPLAGLTGKALKAYAAEAGIDLGSATKVADMRAVITAAEDADNVAGAATDDAPDADGDPAPVGGDEDDEAADAADESSSEND